MASNNRKPPHQPSVSKVAGGWKNKTASQQSSKTTSERRDNKHKVMTTLQSTFKNIFDTEIIQAVAQNCGWKLDKSVATLVMLSEGGNNKKPVNPQKKSKPVKPAGSIKKQNPIPTANNHKKQVVYIPELPNKKPAKNKKEYSKVTDHKPFHTKSGFIHKQQKATLGYHHFPKKVVGNEHSRPIKVSYKAINQLDVSDDDADVVIEEENEFEVVGNGIRTFPFPSTSCPSVSQFLTPVMPHIPQNVNVVKQPQLIVVNKRQYGVAPPNDGRKITGKVEGKEGMLTSVQMVQHKVKPMTGLERVRKLIFDCTKVMVLMRGCPGSGKSFLAKYIIKSTVGGNHNNYIFTTDNFFVNIGCGKYVFVPAQLPEAHAWNQNVVLEKAKCGTNPIIVDNTNLEAWEMQPYAAIAVKHGYSLELLEPSTSWRYNSAELARKTVHNVPHKKIQDMLDRFEHDLTGGKLLAILKLKYCPSNKPPQPSAKPVLYSQSIQLTKDNAAATTKTTKKTKSRKKKVQDEKHFNTQGVSGVELMNKYVNDTRAAELTDALAVFFAKKAHDQGQPLERDIFKNKLKSGHTIHDVLFNMCKPQSTTVNQNAPEENSNSESSELVDLMHSLTTDAQEATANLFENSQKDSSSCADSTSDSDSDNTDDSDDLSIDDEAAQMVGEWPRGEDEWKYQSDEDERNVSESGEVTDSSSEEENRWLQNDEDGKLELLLDGSVKKCMEYALVLEDNTLLFQKSHDVTSDVAVESDVLKCNPEGNPGQCWEYVLITEDSQNLPQKSYIENDMKPLVSSENTSQNKEKIATNADELPLDVMELCERYVLLKDKSRIDNVIKSHDNLDLAENMDGSLIDVTESNKNHSATTDNTDEMILESPLNLVAKMYISKKSAMEEGYTAIGNTHINEAKSNLAAVAENSHNMDIIESDSIPTFKESINEPTLYKTDTNRNLVTVLGNTEGILVDVTETSEMCAAVVANIHKTELNVVEPHGVSATMIGNTLLDVEEFRKGTDIMASDNSSYNSELNVKLSTSGFVNSIECNTSHQVETNHEIVQNEVSIAEEYCTDKELIGANEPSPVPVTSRLISSDEMDQWLRSLEPSIGSKETDIENIPMDLTQSNLNTLHQTNIGDPSAQFEGSGETITEKSSGSHIEVQEMRIQDAASTEEDFESAVSSTESDGDAHDDNQTKKSEFCIKFKNIKQVPKVDFISWFRSCKSEVTSGGKSTVECSKTTEVSCNQEQNTLSPSRTDLLQEWERGNMWDEAEVKEHDASLRTVEDPLMPRPARKQRHQVIVKTLAEVQSLDVEEKASVSIEPLPPEVKSWLAVAEPIASWEENNDYDPVQETNRSTTPQPQRLMFATSLTKQKESLLWGKDADITAVFPDRSAVESMQTSWKDGNKMDDKTEQNILCTNEDNFTGPELCDISSHIIENVIISKVTVNSSTNTHYSDFELLTSANAGSVMQVPSEVVLRVAQSRNITEDCRTELASEPSRKSRVLLLDKSSMTLQEDEMDMDVRCQFEELARIFPEISLDNLSEIYKKCNMDLHWTVDVLLESESERLPEDSSGAGTLQMEGKGYSITNEGCSESASIHPLSDSLEAKLDIEQALTELVLPLDTSSSVSECKVKSASPSKRNVKKDRNAPVSDTSLQLKKQLEENFVINDEHYSEHTLRIRKIRHGEVLDMGELTQPMRLSVQGLPITTDSQVSGTKSKPFQIGEDMSVVGAGSSHVTSTNNFLFCTEKSSTIDNVAEEVGALARELISEGSEIEQLDSSFEEEETVPLTLDKNFIDRLHKLFGSTGFSFQQGAPPVVNLPLMVARQIHYYLMDAQQSAYELMMQEDEELARQLQEQEQEKVAQPKVPDLREIMDMEMALALYKTDQSRWKSEGKDDLATKLSRQLLCDTFPTLPHDVLMEVFQAHNNSFEATFEVLLASMSQNEDSVLTVMTPEARAAHERALLEQAKQEGLKNTHVVQPPDRNTSEEDEGTEEQAFRDAEYYRSEASHHYQLRNECYQKAQDAYRNGLTSAASYYSQVANLHKKRIDDFNARAASSLLLAHSLGCINTTLDLHFLYVAEALQVLDMFLDHHIRRLSENMPALRRETLYLITGRGLRSVGGRSRIKPAVTTHLKQRGLKYVEVNPGLLKVTVTKHVPISNCL